LARTSTRKDRGKDTSGNKLVGRHKGRFERQVGRISWRSYREVKTPGRHAERGELVCRLSRIGTNWNPRTEKKSKRHRLQNPKVRKPTYSCVPISAMKNPSNLFVQHISEGPPRLSFFAADFSGEVGFNTRALVNAEATRLERLAQDRRSL